MGAIRKGTTLVNPSIMPTMHRQVDNSTNFCVEFLKAHGGSLQAYPPEIVHSIANFLDLDSVLNLRLTCQTLHSIVTPAALRNITLLARRNSYYVDGIERRLSTCSLVTAPDENSEPPIFPDSRLTNLYTYARHLTIIVNSTRVYEILYHSDLPAVLATLKQLRSLRSLTLAWYLPRGGMQESNIFVVNLQEAICWSVLKATGGRLEQLTITPTLNEFNSRAVPHSASLHTPITLSMFPRCLLEVRGLKKFEFSCDEAGWGCWTRDEWDRRPVQRRIQRASSNSEELPKCCLSKAFGDGVRRIIEANPGIEDLSLKYGCAMSDLTWGTLGASSHVFERLALNGVAFPQAFKDVSHFQNLTHLVITTPSFDRSLENLWLTLLNNNSQSLTSIQTAQVTPSFIHFLSSFTGLKMLIINSLEPDGLTEEAPPHSLLVLGHDFFTKALPNHTPTLRQLSISFADNVRNIPGWTYTPSYFVPNFSRMSSLRHLALYPSPMDENTDPEIVITAYQSILDDIEDACPTDLNHRESSTLGSQRTGIASSLESLKIFWPNETFECGTGYEQWSEDVEELLNTVVDRLRSRRGVPHELIVQTGTYRSKALGDGSWGYEKISS